MSHQSVVLLMKDVAESLADNVQFGYGRRSDFNLIQSKNPPFIWLLPLTANPIYTNNNNTENYQKAWNCIVFFAEQDSDSSTETEYKPILDTTDELLDKFVNRLNDFYLSNQDAVGPLTIRNLSQTPFFKSDAGVFTGWFLSFQLVVSDDFVYCTPDNIVLYGT